jgi:type IV pilus assembly protein PilC
MLIDYETESGGSVKTRQFLTRLYDETKDGGSLSAAAKAVGGFPKYAVDMFIIGEKTGRLDSVLLSLAGFYDRDAKIKDSIKSAIVFPIVLFALLIGVMWILLTQVLPVFESVFERLGVQFNSTAGSLMRLGGFVERFAVVILAVIAVIVVLGFVAYKVDSLREGVKSVFAGIFTGSKLMKSLLAARFSASMAMTLKSGLDIDQSLELAYAFATNKQAAAKIAQCKRVVAQGRTFNEAVLESEILSPVYCRMLALSFKTGSADEIMELIAEKSEDEATVCIETLIGRIEPALAFIMSLLIGLVLLSVMFPLLAVINT